MIKIEVPKTPAQLRQEQRDEERQHAKELHKERVSNEFAGWALIFTALAPAEAFLLMLVLGALHSVAAPVAAVGYGTAYLLVLGVDLVAFMAGRFRRSEQ
ncbi:hypothetical protein ACFWMJ_23620 [Streptomyces hawaiiensis]|uniref:hypothetical protein n=1 Tax=Streptomyces hawaiiensis TaxID=67305 RepID=UPI003654D8D1